MSRVTSRETFKGEREVIKNSARTTGVSQGCPRHTRTCGHPTQERQSKSDMEGVKGQSPPPAPSTFVGRGSNSLWPYGVHPLIGDSPHPAVSSCLWITLTDLELPLFELNSVHVTPHPKGLTPPAPRLRSQMQFLCFCLCVISAIKKESLGL